MARAFLSLLSSFVFAFVFVFAFEPFFFAVAAASWRSCPAEALARYPWCPPERYLTSGHMPMLSLSLRKLALACR